MRRYLIHREIDHDGVYQETIRPIRLDDGRVVPALVYLADRGHRQFAGNNAEKGETVGCYFYGEKGTMHIGWQKGWTFYPVDGRQPVQHEDPQLGKPDDQNIKELWADFLKAIQSGGRPVSDIEEVHRSTNLALLGMLSYKLGRSVAWNGETELCPGDEEANKLLRREYRKGWEYPAVV